MRLKLKPIPMELLILLIERRAELVTREQIVEQIWGKGLILDTDNAINSAISRIRQVLGDSIEQPRFVLTIPGKGYRFISPVVIPANEPVAPPQPEPPERRKAVSGPRLKNRTWVYAAAAMAAILVAAAGTLYYRAHRARLLTEKDVILLADFANNTGDPIFDETLKQALLIELRQSPFLKVASDLQVEQVLQRMGRPPESALRGELAAEVCLRMGGKAIFAGSISKLGSQYIVGLQALGCSKGETLAAAQTQAPNKEGVLAALGRVTSEVRLKAGESLPSLEKYDFPVDATTKSLEALKAFSLGLKAEHDQSPSEAVPFYRQAIELDPDFALAYATLGRAHADFGEQAEAVRDYSQAFRLRDRLSEREKFFVTTLYNETVPGDLEIARQAGVMWTTTYPRDEYAREKLGTVENDLGENEASYEQAKESWRLDAASEINLFNACAGAMATGRMQEAEEMLQNARKSGLDGEGVHLAIYQIAFEQGDLAEMNRQVAWANGQPGIEEVLLGLQAETQAYFGRISRARELTERATKAGKRDHAPETAADYQVVAALRELEIGNVPGAGAYLRSAMSLAPTRDVKAQVALAWARSGEAARARRLLKELAIANPDNTLLKFYWGPTINAAVALHAGHPDTAISELKTTAPYELSQAPPLGDDVFLYPVYIRGEAFLAAHDGVAAAAEFRKILDHPGVALQSLVGALARLGLARAYNHAGDLGKARQAYQDFLRLWKDADPDVPILKQARAEYAKLQ